MSTVAIHPSATRVESIKARDVGAMDLVFVTIEEAPYSLTEIVLNREHWQQAVNALAAVGIVAQEVAADVLP